MRVAILAALVVALLICCGFAFLLVMEKRESSVTAETEQRLSSVSSSMARDFIRKQGPSISSPSAVPESDDAASLITAAALQNERGTEGGFYSSRADRLFGYAYPSHEGPGVKRDIPPIERPMIEDVARRASRQGQSVSYTFRGARDVILFEAAPIIVNGNKVGSAWVMKRLAGLRSEYDLKLALGAAGFVALSLMCVLLAFFVARDMGTGVSHIEARLQELDHDLSSEAKPFSGLTELARIHHGVNYLADSLRQKIDQERDLREQLRHKERLAALGQVAAGVAHEIRNPLATVRLRTQMTQRAAPDISVQQNCTIVLEEIERLNGIVEQLLFFSRPLKLTIESFDPIVLVRECMESMTELLRDKEIHLRMQPEETDILLRADRSKLRQVMDNVLSNAIDAVGDKGIVDVRISRQDGLVTIECQDDGHGIPEEIRDRLFDPFFTTRSTGTGLGLSIAYEIVRAHEGTILVTPVAGTGTVVTIRLPLSGPELPTTGVVAAETVQSEKA